MHVVGVGFRCGRGSLGFPLLFQLFLRLHRTFDCSPRPAFSILLTFLKQLCVFRVEVVSDAALPTLCLDYMYKVGKFLLQLSVDLPKTQLSWVDVD